MKKMIVLCACIWAVLLTACVGVYSFAKNLDPLLEAPVITSVYNKDGSVVLTWSPVEYATIYSIHRRIGTGDWEFVKSVSSSKRMYTDEGAAGKQYQYVMRACNVSLEEFHWSGFSAAVTAP